MTEDSVNVALRDISEKIGELKGIVSGIASEQTRAAEGQDAVVMRVGALERRDARMLGAASVVSAVVGFLAGWISRITGGQQ